MQMPESILDLQKLLSRNLAFHAVISQEVKETPYGQITFNIVLKNGEAQLSTLNIVSNKRTKYLTSDKDSDSIWLLIPMNE